MSTWEERCEELEGEIDDLKAKLNHIRNLNTLVPVPVGEVCAIRDCETEHFVVHGVVHYIPDGEFYGVPFGDERPHFLSHYGNSQTIVQPVRLVPLTEWMEGRSDG